MKEHSVQGYTRTHLEDLRFSFLVQYRHGRGPGFTRSRNCLSKCRVWDKSYCMLCDPQTPGHAMWVGCFLEFYGLQVPETRSICSDPGLWKGYILWDRLGSIVTQFVVMETSGCCLTICHWTGKGAINEPGQGCQLPNPALSILISPARPHFFVFNFYLN